MDRPAWHFLTQRLTMGQSGWEPESCTIPPVSLFVAVPDVLSGVLACITTYQIFGWDEELFSVLHTDGEMKSKRGQEV